MSVGFVLSSFSTGVHSRLRRLSKRADSCWRQPRRMVNSSTCRRPATTNVAQLMVSRYLVQVNSCTGGATSIYGFAVICQRAQLSVYRLPTLNIWRTTSHSVSNQSDQVNEVF